MGLEIITSVAICFSLMNGIGCDNRRPDRSAEDASGECNVQAAQE
jgi:hypothetical protein